MKSGLGLAAAAATLTLPGFQDERLHSPGALAASLSSIANGTKTQGKAIFGSTEIASNSFKALPQWVRVLKKMKLETDLLSKCTRDRNACGKYALHPWHDTIKKAQGQSRSKTLQAINKGFNRWPYKYDQELYGVSEYWASPMEFLRRSGDCEDYSIAKYFALRELGFDKDQLRVVILYDRIRNIGHAVLAVYERNDILVLDSLSNLILSHRKYRHYQPQYSMNEITRWAHVII